MRLLHTISPSFRFGPAALLILLAGQFTATAAALETRSLDDGTTLVLVEDHRAPIVHLRFVFPAGSWSPWFREAHAEEAFRIQFHDSAGELRSRADRFALDIELGVGDRTSTLSASCLKQDLARAVGLIGELLENRDFDRKELKRWKQGRKLSWTAAQKSPVFRAGQESARRLFAAGDPRRGRFEAPPPVLTDVERLAAVRDNLIRLPGRRAGFAGDLTWAEAERIVSRVLPALRDVLPDGLAPQFAPISPLGGADVTVALRRLTQVYFAYVRDSLPSDSPDYPAFLVADHVLGGHFYSRLYVALRHEGGETYGAGTINLGDRIPGPYALGTFTRTPNREVAEAKLRAVLRTLHERGITEDERQAAIGFLSGRLSFRRQSPAQQLDRALHSLAQGLAPGHFEEQVAQAAELDLERINRFVERFFDPAAFSMVRVAPR